MGQRGVILAVALGLVTGLVMPGVVPKGSELQVRVYGFRGNWFWMNLGWYRNRTIPQDRH
jgi:hypothetical protein